MQTRKKTLHRLTVLYLIFFAVIAISLILSVNAPPFNEGFTTGRNDAIRMIGDKSGGESVNIIYDLRTSTGNMDFSTPVFTPLGDGIRIAIRPSSVDVEAIFPPGKKLGSTIWSLLCTCLALLAYAATFVVIFLILTSLRRSIRGSDGFDRKNIVLTRLIAILLIAGSLLFSASSWLDAHALAPYFSGSPYALNTAFPFNVAELIMGLLIFVVAEIFVIGNWLSEEQRLTI